MEWYPMAIPAIYNKPIDGTDVTAAVRCFVVNMVYRSSTDEVLAVAIDSNGRFIDAPLACFGVGNFVLQQLERHAHRRN